MPGSGRPLLDAALAACGDAVRWDQRSTARLSLRIGGAILATRLRNPFPRQYVVELSTRELRAVLSPFGLPGGRGVFAGDSVRIESSSGQLIAERTGARAHAQQHARWDDLDLLYFLGYALWNYLNTPFLFRWDGFQVDELDPAREPSGQQLRRLRVQYPPHVPTHCREQVLYYNDRSQLVRLDYCAEIFSPHAIGAHLCMAHRTWDGFEFPSHRRVVPLWRGHRPLLWTPSVMEGYIDDFSLR